MIAKQMPGTGDSRKENTKISNIMRKKSKYTSSLWIEIQTDDKISGMMEEGVYPLLNPGFVFHIYRILPGVMYSRV